MAEIPPQAREERPAGANSHDPLDALLDAVHFEVSPHLLFGLKEDHVPPVRLARRRRFLPASGAAPGGEMVGQLVHASLTRLRASRRLAQPESGFRLWRSSRQSDLRATAMGLTARSMRSPKPGSRPEGRSHNRNGDGACGIRLAPAADGAVEDVGALAEEFLRLDVRAEDHERAEGFRGMSAVFHEIVTVIAPPVCGMVTEPLRVPQSQVIPGAATSPVMSPSGEDTST